MYWPLDNTSVLICKSYFDTLINRPEAVNETTAGKKELSSGLAVEMYFLYVSYILIHYPFYPHGQSRKPWKPSLNGSWSPSLKKEGHNMRYSYFSTSQLLYLHNRIWDYSEYDNAESHKVKMMHFCIFGRVVVPVDCYFSMPQTMTNNSLQEWPRRSDKEARWTKKRGLTAAGMETTNEEITALMHMRKK